MGTSYFTVSLSKRYNNLNIGPSGVKKLYNISKSCGCDICVTVRNPHPTPPADPCPPKIEFTNNGNTSCRSLILARSIMIPSSAHRWTSGRLRISNIRFWKLWNNKWMFDFVEGYVMKSPALNRWVNLRLHFPCLFRWNLWIWLIGFGLFVLH